MKAIFASLFIFLVFFLSCSNPQSDIKDVSEDYDNTLKTYLDLESKKITWTEEIEPNVISEKKKKDSSLFGNSRYSIPEVASALKPLEEDLIYPGIEGMGLLDISAIDDSLKKLINDFCSELIIYSDNSKERKNTVLYNSFEPEYNYILTIFLYDMENLPVLNKYLIFAPYQDDKYNKIPVRLYSLEGYIDMELFAVETGQGWRFEQIKYGEFVNE